MDRKLWGQIELEIDGVRLMKEKTDILIIDDDPISRFLIVNKIKKYRSDLVLVEMKSAEEAYQALTAADALWPKVILSDINMYGMDGWNLMLALAPLLLRYSRTEVYMVTSSDSMVDVMNLAKNPRVLGLITKPVTTENIESITESLPVNPAS